MLENIIEILLSSDFCRDTMPILLINQAFYNNPYLWNKIVNKTHYKNKTLLMMYAINNNLPRTKLLLAAGANTNMVDSENRTAMIYALAGDADTAPHKCRQCNLKIIEEICKRHINLDIVDSEHETAIFYAIRMKYVDALKILCRYKFNINYKNARNQTAMILTIRENNFEMGYELWKAGADINTLDYDNHNFLMVAINNMNVSNEQIKEILEGGADVNVSDRNGCTPLMYAITLRTVEEVKLLLSYNADVNSTNAKYQSPLMYAVVKNNIEIINLICEKKVNSINFTNSIDCATFLKNHEIANLLKKKLRKIR